MKIKKHHLVKILLISLFVVGSALVSFQLAWAAEGIPYRPNITIPGSNFIKDREIMITADSFAYYVKELYRYAGIIAGAFAMFMLVYGAWQWLMAAGNASKIAMAKETVSTTLVGLAFLFGGYLLLSQISTSLVNFQPLVVKTPEMLDPNATCIAHAKDYTCGQPFQFDLYNPATQATSTVKCNFGYKCEENNSCQTMVLVREQSTYVDCNQGASTCSCRNINAPRIEYRPGRL